MEGQTGRSPGRGPIAAAQAGARLGRLLCWCHDGWVRCARHISGCWIREEDATQTGTWPQSLSQAWAAPEERVVCVTAACEAAPSQGLYSVPTQCVDGVWPCRDKTCEGGGRPASRARCASEGAEIAWLAGHDLTAAARLSPPASVYVVAAGRPASVFCFFFSFSSLSCFSAARDAELVFGPVVLSALIWEPSLRAAPQQRRDPSLPLSAPPDKSPVLLP